MYKVHMTYFDFDLNASFDTLEEAKAIGIGTGFSFSVMKDGITVGFYEIIGGWVGF